ncbi:MAG: sigma-70 family RNA polymerase sigma factor [Phycisphaerae bacterium]
MSSRQDITQALVAVANDDQAAVAKLMPLVYAELRALAGRQLQRERRNHTLQATALVNEAYLRLVDQTQVDWKGKAHFLAVAAEVIRRILVDHARKRGAAKRGGGARQITITLESAEAGPGWAPNVDLLALDEALRELSELSERQAQVVQLRFFGGLSVEETAYALGVSERTIKGDWRVARAWLRRRLSP